MGRDLHEITWREFLDALTAHGVGMHEIEDGPDGEPAWYLRRVSNPSVRWAPLPRHYDLEQPVGARTLDSICRRLGLHTTRDFPGWSIRL